MLDAIYSRAIRLASDRLTLEDRHGPLVHDQAERSGSPLIG